MARIVLITGAAGGIGRAMVAAALAAGHSVAALDRDTAALEALAAAHPGAALHPILADLATEAGCATAIDDTIARFGRIDAVVNNAGIGPSSLRPDAETRLPTIEELDAATWDRFFAINVRAPMLLTRAALPMMKAARWGRVVNNTTSFRTMLRVLPYGATKSALESASAVWAEELAGCGVTVNVLIPGGPTDTAFIGAGASWPRERMLRPAIMGPPLAWLLSDAADGVTGQRITAGRWDAGTPQAPAAMRPIGWPELAADAVWLAAGPGAP
ncbi:SDR family oxidoreductase [Roseomonas sp. HJA6]|uniref:SDR family oxidoreductase n=1 Tax=Roseomonas alba TaxID=2846776 RepID=A0ABS7A4Z3_9PROT|nr:SDR family oxidoreductase [Neoroseomonas alba]MBW6396244.1 SDR family oxidoreductase [Neoroseomonas alba]